MLLHEKTIPPSSAHIQGNTLACTPSTAMWFRKLLAATLQVNHPKIRYPFVFSRKFWYPLYRATGKGEFSYVILMILKTMAWPYIRKNHILKQRKGPAEGRMIVHRLYWKAYNRVSTTKGCFPWSSRVLSGTSFPCFAISITIPPGLITAQIPKYKWRGYTTLRNNLERKKEAAYLKAKNKHHTKPQHQGILTDILCQAQGIHEPVRN